MATSLNGTTPQATYESLLKLGDNSALSATLKRISDGAGNDTPIEISTAAVQFGGSTGMYWDNTNRRLSIGTNDANNRVLRVVGQSRLADLVVGFGLNSKIINAVSGSASMNIDSVGVSLADLATNLTPTARLHVRGSGATSATTALRVENSAGTAALTITDDGGSVFNSGTTSTPIISRTASTTTAFEMQNASSTRRFRILANPTLATLESSNTDGFTTNSALNVGGSTSNNASAILQADSTTRGFLPPRMTTTQKNAIASPAAGLMVYDTDTNKLCCYNGTTWNDLF